MARKTKVQKEKTAAEKENLEANVKDDALKNDAETDRTLEDGKLVDGGQVINPIAYAIKLRSIHPHDSYGRCGYRFYKDKETEIPANDLTGEQVLTLAEDPWLELVPVCEE